jgi:hypothetical protein
MGEQSRLSTWPDVDVLTKLKRDSLHDVTLTSDGEVSLHDWCRQTLSGFVHNHEIVRKQLSPIWVHV